MRRMIVCLCIVMMASCAEAFTIHEYLIVRDIKEGTLPSVAAAYIMGLGEGLAWANTVLHDAQGRRLFCPPDHIVLDGEGYKRILDETIARLQSTAYFEKTRNQRALGYYILLGLQQAFPCKKP
jgi:hypothetical protein